MYKSIDLSMLGYDGVNKLTEDEILDGVHNHINWIQSACGDMAQYDPDTFDKRTDWTEIDCAADDAYDDPELLRSLIGDYLPLQQGSDATFMILFHLWDVGHSAIKQAVESMYDYLCEPKKGEV